MGIDQLDYKPIYRLFDDVTQLKINPIYNLLTTLEKTEHNKSVILKKADNLHTKFFSRGKLLKPSVVIQKLLAALDESYPDGEVSRRVFEWKGRRVATIIISKKDKINVEISNKDINTLKIEERKECLANLVKELEGAFS